MATSTKETDMSFNTKGEQQIGWRVIDDVDTAVYINQGGDRYVYADPIVVNEGYCPDCEAPQYEQVIQLLSRGD
jgi:hypothetical protein